MQAIGMIETRGLVTAIEALDAMMKAANVVFLKKAQVGGGLVTVIVEGEVGAVKAAVEAGNACAARVGEVVGTHVIPRPVREVAQLLDELDEEPLAGPQPAATTAQAGQPFAAVAEDAAPRPVQSMPAPVQAPKQEKQPEPRPVATAAPAAQPRPQAAPVPVATPAAPPAPAAEYTKMTVPQLRSYLRKLAGKTLKPEEIKFANRAMLLQDIEQALRA